VSDFDFPEIRPAALADSAGVYAACIASIQEGGPKGHTAAEVEAWANRITEARLRSKIESLQFYVAEAAHHGIVGFSALDESTSELAYLYVHPVAMGLGLGRRLVETVECEARRLGLRHLNLVGSLNAVGFYRHIGFVANETIVRDIDGVPIQCVKMSKQL